MCRFLGMFNVEEHDADVGIVRRAEEGRSGGDGAEGIERSIDQADSYAATRIPLMQGRFPYANIHRELVEAFLALDAKLNS